MIIDIKDNQINLNVNYSLLKPRHKSQLSFWGFKSSKENDNYYSIDKPLNILPKIISYFDKKNVDYELSKNCSDFFEDINSSLEEFNSCFNISKDYKNGVYDHLDFENHQAFLKENIPTRKLREHQEKAFYHLCLMGNGANFSVPGAGKTTVILSYYEKLRLDNKVNKIFVVGPPACFGPWKDEFEEVLGRKPKLKILAGGNKSDRKEEYYNHSSEIYLTSFQTLMNDYNEVNSFLNSNDISALLVIDEAHYFKRVDGSWANAVLSIAENASYRCVLTGTPMPKSYSDLYNIIDFLWPNIHPIKSKDKNSLKLFEENNDSESASELLEELVGPIFYRVRKKELNLEKQIFNEPIMIKMGELERTVYDAIENKIRNYAVDDYLHNIDLVAKLRRGRMIRLRQCVSLTSLLSTAITDYSEELIDSKNTDLRNIILNYEKKELPSKLIKLLEMVTDFQKKGDKVVIWAHFIGTIELIKKHITKLGFKSRKIIGATPVSGSDEIVDGSRESIRNEFVDPDSGIDILLANPAACAESISLHQNCYNAIYYDLTYNCAQYLQSLDRIHRVGGSEEHKAYYHFLHYENTIDSDIFLNLKQKAQRMYKVIEGDYNIYSLDILENNDEENAYERLFLPKE